MTRIPCNVLRLSNDRESGIFLIVLSLGDHAACGRAGGMTNTVLYVHASSNLRWNCNIHKYYYLLGVPKQGPHAKLCQTIVGSVHYYSTHAMKLPVLTSTTASSSASTTLISSPASSSTRSFGGAGWHYPILGFTYLLSSSTMRNLVLGNVLSTMVITLVILKLLFGHTYEQQVETIRESFVSILGEDQVGEGNEDDKIHWYIYFLATLAVLFEATMLTMKFLSCCTCVGKTQRKIFIATMKLKGFWNVETMIEPHPFNGFPFCCSFDCSNCRKLNSFMLSVATFPLHVMFPLIGTLLYAFINAHYTAWDYLDLYYDCISLDGTEQRLQILGDRNTWLSRYNVFTNKYLQFGFVVALLEIIPIFGPSLFALSNACGTALWACDDMEMVRKMNHRQQKDQLRQGQEQRIISNSGGEIYNAMV